MCLQMDRKTIDATLETLRLKEESRLMEERLAMLKNLMTAEKASRRAANSAFWASGQKGPLKKQHVPEQQKTPKATKIRILTDTNAESSKVIPLCDKCGKYRPSVSCLECAEDYCSACFIRLHQNGALADHHASPIMRQEIASLKTNTTKQWRGNKCMEPRDCTVEDHTHNEPVEHNRENIGHVHAPFQRDTPLQRNTPGVQGGSLLQGTYDEEASSASFQEALREWRAAAGHDSRDNQEQQTILIRDNSTAPKVSTEVQSIPLCVAPNTIEFTRGGVSYLEKLMIRSHRVDPLFLPSLSKKRRSPSGQGMQEWEGPCEQEPSEYNIFYSAEPAEMANGIDTFDLQSCLLGVENIHLPFEEMVETINHTSSIVTTDNITTTATDVTTTTITTDVTTTITADVITTTCDEPTKSVSTKLGHKRAEKTSLAGDHGPSNAPKVHKLVGQDNSNSAKTVRHSFIPPLGGVTAPLPESAMFINGMGDQEDAGQGTGDQQDTDRETLSGFFLSEVEPHPSKPQHPQAHVTSPCYNHGNTSCGHSSKFVLGAAIWLPENSWLSTNREASETINPATVLPPPSPMASQEQGPDDDDSSSHEGGGGDEVCSVEEGWDDRDDLEAIESLAWELSSNADGRMIGSDGGEGEWPQEVGASISTVSVDQVMEQFDLYRKSVMSQES